MRNIKATHKPIKTFYAELKQYESLGATNETEVRLAFATLLQHYARQNNLTLICEKSIRTPQDNIIYRISVSKPLNSFGGCRHRPLGKD